MEGERRPAYTLGEASAPALVPARGGGILPPPILSTASPSSLRLTPLLRGVASSLGRTSSVVEHTVRKHSMRGMKRMVREDSATFSSAFSCSFSSAALEPCSFPPSMSMSMSLMPSRSRTRSKHAQRDSHNLPARMRLTRTATTSASAAAAPASPVVRLRRAVMSRSTYRSRTSLRPTGVLSWGRAMAAAALSCCCATSTSVLCRSENSIAARAASSAPTSARWSRKRVQLASHRERLRIQRVSLLRAEPPHSALPATIHSTRASAAPSTGKGIRRTCTSGATSSVALAADPVKGATGAGTGAGEGAEEGADGAGTDAGALEGPSSSSDVGAGVVVGTEEEEEEEEEEEAEPVSVRCLLRPLSAPSSSSWIVCRPCPTPSLMPLAFTARLARSFACRTVSLASRPHSSSSTCSTYSRFIELADCGLPSSCSRLPNSHTPAGSSPLPTLGCLITSYHTSLSVLRNTKLTPHRMRRRCRGSLRATSAASYSSNRSASKASGGDCGSPAATHAGLACSAARPRTQATALAPPCERQPSSALSSHARPRG
mmetsp:Transcript_2910/g.6731  ORF Transcript_2910/g.6731 Transcript_2910/m.6731 type:complete len:546 (+) Transcript_2910:1688-3325(+)